MLFTNPSVMQVTEFAISNRSRKIYLAVSCVTEERERKRNGKGAETKKEKKTEVGEGTDRGRGST